MCLQAEGEERLEYKMVEGSCRSAEVMGYLDALAQEAEKADEEVVVVMDNAPLHTAGIIREREEEWVGSGLRLYRLPAYCPHLNLIEGGVAQAEGLPHAQALLRLGWGVEGSPTTRSATLRGGGGSNPAWRYLRDGLCHPT